MDVAVDARLEHRFGKLGLEDVGDSDLTRTADIVAFISSQTERA